jgi:hypothetical protein
VGWSWRPTPAGLREWALALSPALGIGLIIGETVFGQARWAVYGVALGLLNFRVLAGPLQILGAGQPVDESPPTGPGSEC